MNRPDHEQNSARPVPDREASGTTESAVEARLRAAFEATADLPDTRRPLPTGATSAGRRRPTWLAPLGAVAATAAVVAGALAAGPLLPGRDTTADTVGGAASALVTPSSDATPRWSQQRTADGKRLWTVTTEVFQRGTAAPILCVGILLYSNPAQCGTAPSLRGWSWDGIEHTNTGGNRLSTTYTLVGTYEPDTTASLPARFGTFTLVRPPVASEPELAPGRIGPEGAPSGIPGLPDDRTRGGVTEEPSPLDDDLSTPCRTPAGGWTTPDPNRATTADRTRLVAAAAARPDFADWWVDPSTGVVNVAVTGDARAATTALRPTWGGPLCVSRIDVTRARLRQVYADLPTHVGDVITKRLKQGHIDLEVVTDPDGRVQADLDRRYGTDIVRVRSALQPYVGDPAASPAAP